MILWPLLLAYTKFSAETQNETKGKKHVIVFQFVHIHTHSEKSYRSLMRERHIWHIPPLVLNHSYHSYKKAANKFIYTWLLSLCPLSRWGDNCKAEYLSILPFVFSNFPKLKQKNVAYYWWGWHMGWHTGNTHKATLVKKYILTQITQIKRYSI